MVYGYAVYYNYKKNVYSKKNVQRQLGHNRYEPIWKMMHKLRSVMGVRDDLYVLKSEVELDEEFFGTVDINRNHEEKLKRGRGSEKQTTVLVSTEILEVDPTKLKNKYAKEIKLGFIKMKVINSLKKEDLKKEVDKIIAKGTKLKTYGSNSYNDFKKNDSIHKPTVAEKSEFSKLLPWVHTSIRNAKKLLLDMHHRIDNDFLKIT